jgi:hypothetical protein
MSDALTIESCLADLTETSLEDLRSCDDEILLAGLGRILARVDNPDHRLFGGDRQRLI